MTPSKSHRLLHDVTANHTKVPYLAGLRSLYLGDLANSLELFISEELQGRQRTVEAQVTSVNGFGSLFCSSTDSTGAQSSV